MSAEEASAFPRVPLGVFEDANFLKKYALERELGVGGAGVVVCARHRELDERVAIKFLLSGSESVEAVARFRREARAAHRVKSEHVVGVVDVSTTETGIPYVVMEYLEGADLERMLLETPDAQLPVRDAIEFVLQACEALAQCHAIGIVHRDLKPSNLFCTHGADGLPIIKVLDFGISKLGSVTIDEAMTGRHAIMGSPRYMSPEQFATPAEVDLRTDIWAIGVILYELVAGQAPFTGNTLISIWERVKADVPKPLEDLRKDAPRALSPIVARCLEKDRANRYQTVAELAKALLPLATDRMRATVARIVRIIEMPGVTTESLSLPPSGHASTGTATSVSVSAPTAQRSLKSLSLPLLVVVGVVAFVLLGRGKQTPSTTAPHGSATVAPAMTARVQSGSVAPPREERPLPVIPNPAVEIQGEMAPPAPVPVASAPLDKSAETPSRAPRPITRTTAASTPPARSAAVMTPPAPATAASSQASPIAAVPVPERSAAPERPAEPERSAPPESSGKAPGWVVDIVERRKAAGEKP